MPFVLTLLPFAFCFLVSDCNFCRFISFISRCAFSHLPSLKAERQLNVWQGGVGFGGAEVVEKVSIWHDIICVPYLYFSLCDNYFYFLSYFVTLFSAFFILHFVFCFLPTGFYFSAFALHLPFSALCCLLFASRICLLNSGVWFFSSVIYSLPSVFCLLVSGVWMLPSTLWLLPSTFYFYAFCLMYSAFCILSSSFCLLLPVFHLPLSNKKWFKSVVKKSV